MEIGGRKRMNKQIVLEGEIKEILPIVRGKIKKITFEELNDPVVIKELSLLYTHIGDFFAMVRFPKETLLTRSEKRKINSTRQTYKQRKKNITRRKK